VALVADLLDVKASPQWGTMTARSWDTNSWVANSLRLQSELGWHPRVSLREGLDSVRSWFEAHPVWLDHYRQTAGFAN
jgi:nucleoside-diphosphate-sugar epimerase